MKRFFIFAVAIASLTGLCRSALAQTNTIIAPTNVIFNGVSGGVSLPSYQLDITYDVTFTPANDLYEYDYTLTTSPSENIYSFSLGGPVDPIDTAGLTITSYGGALPSASGFNSMSVVWGWAESSATTFATISFTSPIGPQLATFTANDDDIAWYAPPPIPAPIPIAPVPEPSTFALLTGLAFVYGLFRYRRAVKQAAKKLAPVKVLRAKR